MSFKDVRDLAEHLKLLGYPKTFPLQSLYSNYGSLNSFKVLADILQWLAGRLEPGSNLPGGTRSEADRVMLIRSATEFFVTKSGIKLNPRKLYASSSASAKELQKITNLLMTTPIESESGEEDNFKSLGQIDLGDKMDDLRRARELSSELTNRGATLYDLLSKELVNKEIRITQSSRPLELSSVERSLKNAIQAAQFKMQSSKSQLESLRVEKNALNAKLQRKKGELDRSKQRLEALTKIRPAYLEEYENLENELRDLFHQFFIRIQCRDALGVQMATRTKNPTPIATPLAKPLDSSMNFIPEGLIDDDDEDDDDIVDDDEKLKEFGDDGPLRIDPDKAAEPREQARVRPTTGRFKPRTGTTIGRHKVIGSMLGDNDDDVLDSTLGSDDSDSDIDIRGAAYDLNSDDDLSISKLTADPAAKPQNKFDHSDEDF